MSPGPNTSACTSIEKLVSETVSALVGCKETTGSGSVYEALESFLRKSEAKEADRKKHILDPSTELNAALSSLVSVLQGKWLRSCNLIRSCVPYSTVAEKACEEISANVAYTVRAAIIKDIACRAEDRLERYYGKLLAKIGREMLCSGTLALEQDAVSLLQEAASEFPYTGNYVSMVEVESNILETCLGTAEKRTNYIGGDGIESVNGLEGMVICVCGSGPLPLSGLLFHAFTGASVILLDVDSTACEIAAELCRVWTELGILLPNSIQIVCADAASVQFSKKRSVSANSSGKKVIQCDVVFVASLIPSEVKEKIAENLCNEEYPGVILAIRTAHGLTAKFAYDSVRREKILKYMNFVGYMAPITHLRHDGTVAGEENPPLRLFPSEILNSLEIYCNKSSEDTKSTLRLSLDDWRYGM